MENTTKIVPALCTQCGGTVEVDPKSETAKCPFCGTTFLVEKAINNYNVKYAHVEHADNVNIDMSGAVKDVLDFVGKRMDEGKQERAERRREEAEQTRKLQGAFLKVMGILFGVMILFGIVMACINAFTGNDGEETINPSEEGGSTIETRVENGCLLIDIEGEDLPQWRYLPFDSQGTVLGYEDMSIDSYSCSVQPEQYVTDGVRYVVNAAYEEAFPDESDTPLYYCVIRVVIKDSDIVEAEDPVFVDSLSEYDFE